MVSKERAEGYFESLFTDLPAELSALESAALAEEVPIIRKESQNVLRFFLEMKEPSRVLEVGTAVGFSALFMRYFAPGAKIDTIEKVEMRLARARENLKSEIDAGNIRLLEGDADDILKELAVKEEGSYDLIFMDAAKAQYMNFLPSVMKCLKKGGLLISDNILHDGDILESRYAVERRDRTIHARMREYLYEITHREDLYTMLLTEGDGMSVSVKK